MLEPSAFAVGVQLNYPWLFFAGEAADFNAHNGTLHGVIASGQHAATKFSLRRARTQTFGQQKIKHLERHLGQNVAPSSTN